MYWSLPGPHSFVRDIVAHVQDGRSVYVLLPENPLPMLQTAVHNLLGETHWRSLEVPAKTSTSPAAWLFDQFIPNKESAALRSATELVADASFQGWFVWLTGVNSENFEQWCEFLLEFAHASRSLTKGVQTSLIIVCQGSTASLPTPKEAGIATLSWNGRLDRLDIALHAALSVNRKPSSLERELIVATIAELAAWDLALLDQLAIVDLVPLLEPKAMLIEYASQCWEEPNLSGDWWTGKCYEVTGQLRLHTCFLAQSSQDELTKLIWRAQVGVLMPYIEEKRRVYLGRYRHLLSPVVVQYGRELPRKVEVAELEVSLLLSQLRKANKVNVNREDLNHLSDLKEARNALAHLRPVAADILTRLCDRESA
jgi:hypothetical protein